MTACRRRRSLAVVLTFCVAVSAVLVAGPAPAPMPPVGTIMEEAHKAASELPRLHSFLVSWRGNLILERYYNGARAGRAANIKSASKSIISALVGIAIDRDLIANVRQPITTYFPELLKAQKDPAKSDITIEDLLTMRSGLETTSNRNYGAWVRSRNWVRHVLDQPLLTPPGTDMDYSTGNTHLLSAIITKASKKNTWRFAQDVLAGPLGFTLAQWPADPQGIYFGGNEMLLTPRQMVTFGELYLNGGRVKEKQIVPTQWVIASFIPRSRSDWSEQMYGYGWWIREVAGRKVYYAWGYGGQFIIVVPDLELVIVTTSSTSVSDERRSHRRTVFDVVERFVLQPLGELTKSDDESAS